MRVPIRIIATALIAAVAIFAAFGVGSADAAPTTVKSDITLQGTGATEGHGTILVHCDPCAPDILFSCGGCEVTVGGHASLNTSVSWTAPASIQTTFDAAQLQQGTTVTLSNALTPGKGTIKIKYNIPWGLGFFAKGGDFGTGGPLPGGWFQTNLTIKDKANLETSASCTPPLAGKPNTTCSKTDTIPIATSPKFLEFAVGISLVINHTFTIGPAGIVAHSVVAGVTQNNLNFKNPLPSVADDPFEVPCGTEAGSSLKYDLTDISYSPSVSVTGTAGIKLTIQIPILPDFEETFNFLSGTVHSTKTLTMTGKPDLNILLGTVGKDKVQPVVQTVGASSGALEGKPVTFTATAKDNCNTQDQLHYKWSFSDGGVAFGRIAQHTFADNGSYSASVRATDKAGNEARGSTSLNVSNVAPVINPASLDKVTAPWGKPIEFSGLASDQGSLDNEKLKYEWDFGDGSARSPNQKTTHVYAQPGNYPASLAVRDHDGDVAAASKPVNITARDTNIKYDGPISRNPNDPKQEIELSATLLDHQGEAVKNRELQFAILDLGGNVLSSETNITDGNGTARVSMDPPGTLEVPVDYIVFIGFKGDVFYNPAHYQKTLTVHENRPADVSPLPTGIKEVWGVPIELSGFATDPDGGAQDTLKYVWDFGDGQSAINQKVQHDYDKPGEYTVRLTVTDKDGAEAFEETRVQINKRDTHIKHCGDVQVPEGQRQVNLCGVLLDSEGEPVIDVDLNEATPVAPRKFLSFTMQVRTPALVVSGPTDANGQIRTAANLNLVAGCFNSTISFDATGNNRYNSSKYEYIFFVTGGGRGPQVCALTIAGTSAGYDVNCDGNENSVDALYILQVVAGLSQFTACANVPNVNGDGVIDVLDALVLLQNESG